MIVARLLQGAGAISSAVFALIADLTRPEVRTRANAGIGASIGMAFGGAFFIPAKSAAMFLVGMIEATGEILMLIGLLSANNLLSAIGASFIVFTSLPKTSIISNLSTLFK